MTHPLSNLPGDIYRVLEGKTLFDPSVVDQFGTTLSEILHKRLRQEDRKPTLRMSNVGRPLRQLYYELNGFEGEKPEGKTLVKFAYGDLCEALVIALAQVAGYKAERLQEEIEVDGIQGHIDLVLGNVLVDVKSCSPYSFAKFKDATLLVSGNDPFGYVGQLCGYAHALGLPAAWIAIEKVSGEICVLDLPKELIDSYDVRTRIDQAKALVGSQVLPERCYTPEPDGKSGNEKLPVGCSYCSHKFECYKDANNGQGLRTFYYSNGPRYLSTVVREPKVESSFTQFTTKPEGLTQEEVNSQT